MNIDSQGNMDYNNPNTTIDNTNQQKKILHFFLQGRDNPATECETDLYDRNSSTQSVFYQSFLIEQIAQNDDSWDQLVWPITSLPSPINQQTTDVVCSFFHLLYTQQQLSNDIQNVLEVSYSDLDTVGVIFYPNEEKLAELIVKLCLVDISFCKFGFGCSNYNFVFQFVLHTN